MTRRDRVHVLCAFGILPVAIWWGVLVMYGWDRVPWWHQLLWLTVALLVGFGYAWADPAIHRGHRFPETQNPAGRTNDQTGRVRGRGQ